MLLLLPKPLYIYGKKNTIPTLKQNKKPKDWFTANSVRKGVSK